MSAAAVSAPITAMGTLLLQVYSEHDASPGSFKGRQIVSRTTDTLLLTPSTFLQYPGNKSFLFSGYMKPPAPELVVFYIQATGYIRIFVDGECILDYWENKPHTYYQPKYDFRKHANHFVPFHVMYATEKNAQLTIDWSGLTFQRTPVRGSGAGLGTGGTMTTQYYLAHCTTETNAVWHNALQVQGPATFHNPHVNFNTIHVKNKVSTSTFSTRELSIQDATNSIEDTIALSNSKGTLEFACDGLKISGVHTDPAYFHMKNVLGISRESASGNTFCHLATPLPGFQWTAQGTGLITTSAIQGTSITTTLNVAGDTQFQRDVKIAGNLQFSGNIYPQRLAVGGKGTTTPVVVGPKLSVIGAANSIADGPHIATFLDTDVSRPVFQVTSLGLNNVTLQCGSALLQQQGSHFSCAFDSGARAFTIDTVNGHTVWHSPHIALQCNNLQLDSETPRCLFGPSWEIGVNTDNAREFSLLWNRQRQWTIADNTTHFWTNQVLIHGALQSESVQATTLAIKESMTASQIQCTTMESQQATILERLSTPKIITESIVVDKTVSFNNGTTTTNHTPRLVLQTSTNHAVVSDTAIGIDGRSGMWYRIGTFESTSAFTWKAHTNTLLQLSGTGDFTLSGAGNTVQFTGIAASGVTFASLHEAIPLRVALGPTFSMVTTAHTFALTARFAEGPDGLAEKEIIHVSNSKLLALNAADIVCLGRLQAPTAQFNAHLVIGDDTQLCVTPSVLYYHANTERVPFLSWNPTLGSVLLKAPQCLYINGSSTNSETSLHSRTLINAGNTGPIELYQGTDRRFILRDNACAFVNTTVSIDGGDLITKKVYTENLFATWIQGVDSISGINIGIRANDIHLSGHKLTLLSLETCQIMATSFSISSAETDAPPLFRIEKEKAVLGCATNITGPLAVISPSQTLAAISCFVEPEQSGTLEWFMIASFTTTCHITVSCTGSTTRFMTNVQPDGTLYPTWDHMNDPKTNLPPPRFLVYKNARMYTVVMQVDTPTHVSLVALPSPAMSPVSCGTGAIPVLLLQEEMQLVIDTNTATETSEMNAVWSIGTLHCLDAFLTHATIESCLDTPNITTRFLNNGLVTLEKDAIRIGASLFPTHDNHQVTLGSPTSPFAQGHVTEFTSDTVHVEKAFLCTAPAFFHGRVESHGTWQGGDAQFNKLDINQHATIPWLVCGAISARPLPIHTDRVIITDTTAPMAYGPDDHYDNNDDFLTRAFQISAASGTIDRAAGLTLTSMSTIQIICGSSANASEDPMSGIGLILDSDSLYVTTPHTRFTHTVECQESVQVQQKLSVHGEFHVMRGKITAGGQQEKEEHWMEDTILYCTHDDPTDFVNDVVHLNLCVPGSYGGHGASNPTPRLSLTSDGSIHCFGNFTSSEKGQFAGLAVTGSIHAGISVSIGEPSVFFDAALYIRAHAVDTASMILADVHGSTFTGMYTNDAGFHIAHWQSDTIDIEPTFSVSPSGQLVVDSISTDTCTSTGLTTSTLAFTNNALPYTTHLNYRAGAPNTFEMVNTAGDLALLSSGKTGLVLAAVSGNAHFSGQVHIQSGVSVDSTATDDEFAALNVRGGAVFGKSILVNHRLILGGGTPSTGRASVSITAPKTLQENYTLVLPDALPKNPQGVFGLVYNAETRQLEWKKEHAPPAEAPPLLSKKARKAGKKGMTTPTMMVGSVTVNMPSTLNTVLSAIAFTEPVTCPYYIYGSIVVAESCLDPVMCTFKAPTETGCLVAVHRFPVSDTSNEQNTQCIIVNYFVVPKQ